MCFESVEEFPSSFGALSGLQELAIGTCNSIEELPPSIGQLTSLRMMCLSYLQIKTLPSAFGALTGLQDLEIACCYSFKELGAVDVAAHAASCRFASTEDVALDN